MAGETREAKGSWRPVDVIVIESVCFAIAKMRGDKAPGGYFYMTPLIGVLDRGSDGLPSFLSHGVPSLVKGEFSDVFDTRDPSREHVALTVRLPQGRSLPLGPYQKFVDWDGDPWDLGTTERLSLSGIERALGGSDFFVRASGLAEEARGGFTEAPPGSAAARIEGLIMYGYADHSLKAARGGSSILSALEEDAANMVKSFKAFLDRERDRARHREKEVIDEMYERPDSGVTGFFTNIISDDQILRVYDDQAKTSPDATKNQE